MPPDLRASDLDAVAAALGPGGFSAVRVGIATAHGLVAPTEAKLIGVPTHILQAYGCRTVTTKRVVSLIPVGRKQLSFMRVCSPDLRLHQKLSNSGYAKRVKSLRYLTRMAMCCAGEGTERHTGSGDGVVRPPEHLLGIALERLERSEVSESFLEPIYSRPPTITAPRAT